MKSKQELKEILTICLLFVLIVLGFCSLVLMAYKESQAEEKRLQTIEEKLEKLLK